VVIYPAGRVGGKNGQSNQRKTKEYLSPFQKFASLSVAYKKELDI